MTWSAEVGPILQAHCTGCHRPGGAAPMPLDTYEDARPWARAIKASVISAKMPPAQVVRGYGSVVGAPTLSPFESALVAAWADGGAPKGGPGLQTGASGEGGPGLQTGAGTALLPRPDTLLRLPVREVEPAGQRATLASESATLGTRAWITGWRFFPNDPAIVQAEFRLADGRYLGSWTPPETVVKLPDDVGVRAVDGAVTVDVTYRRAQLQQDFPVGRPRHPPVIGLFTTRTPPARRYETVVTGCEDTTLDVGGDVLSVRASTVRDAGSIAVALAPSDAAPVLAVAVRDLTTDRAPTYWLRRPIRVASGTRALVDADVPGCRVWLGVAVQ